MTDDALHHTARRVRPRGRRLGDARAVLAAALLLLPTAAAVLPAQLGAQSTQAAAPAHHRVPRRLLYAAIGAGLGVGLSSLYAEGGNQQGTCNSVACVRIVSIGTGTFVGFLMGREADKLHSIRYRTGTPLSPKMVTTDVAPDPAVLAVADSVVAVAGPGGVDVFTAARAGLRTPPVHRAGGVHGITAVAVQPRSGALAVASPAGLYLYPPRSGPGSLLREGAATAAAASGDGRVFLAVGTRVEAARAATTDSAHGWPGLDLGRPVQELVYDPARNLLWAGTDSTLYALRPVGDSIERVGQLAMGAAVRHVAVEGTRVAVALGESGVRLFDAHDPAAPVAPLHWSGARFAYDVALSPRRLFVAAGSEGLYVLDAAGGSRLVLGLARELGFVIGVETHGADTWVLDRAGPSLHRIATQF